MGLFGTARFPSDRKKRAPYHMRNSFHLLLGHDLSKLFYANPAYFPKILNRSLKKTNTISAMKNISPIM